MGIKAYLKRLIAPAWHDNLQLWDFGSVNNHLDGWTDHNGLLWHKLPQNCTNRYNKAVNQGILAKNSLKSAHYTIFRVGSNDRKGTLHPFHEKTASDFADGLLILRIAEADTLRDVPTVQRMLQKHDYKIMNKHVKIPLPNELNIIKKRLNFHPLKT